MKKRDKFSHIVQLATEYEQELMHIDVPFYEYPRPQMRRNSYLCLNGEWDFTIRKNDKVRYSGKILVPFVPESRISGVFQSVDKKDVMIYERKFVLSEDFVEDRIILHFGACDQYASVYVNDIFVGDNTGGYLAFSFEITDVAHLGSNTVRVEAKDPLCKELPYGKQTDRRGGMWYTKTSGIWQTVWLESVPSEYVKSIKISTDLHGASIKVLGGSAEKTLIFNGKSYNFSSDEFRLEVESPRLWTPDDPYLYEFQLLCGNDKISSYFGLRTVSIETRKDRPLICLNGEPVFCHGLLDQGYFSDGIFLPATPQGFKDDILEMKKCGFNMLRKHIKLEPDLFYYYCDKYGMLVFQDMINSGNYSFFADTALPTLFLKKGVSHHASKRRRKEFDKTCAGIINSLYNHPSVVYYTIFNEGWGQFAPAEFYEKLKALDPSRIYDTTSGWFKVPQSDVESDHVYFKPIRLKAVKGKPMVLSEFGGYVCKIDGHSFNTKNTYGYKLFDSVESFENALISLYEEQVLPAIDDGLCATVYTQVSDVEDETNGLLTYDRKVLKVNAERMNNMSRRLYEKFNNKY